MHKTLRGAVTGLALALAASPAWAADGLSLGMELTWTLSDGNIERTQRQTLSYDFNRFELLGSTGSFRVSLDSPFLITDPDLDKIALDATLFWFPSAETTPIVLQVRTPLNTIAPSLINDPDAGGRPSIRIILPRPLNWRWVPQPFFEAPLGGELDLTVGLGIFHLSARDTLPGSTNFLVDGLRVDYTLSAMPVQVVPVPAALPLMLSGLVGFGVLARRRRSAA